MSWRNNCPSTSPGLAKSGEESHISYEETCEGLPHVATWIAKCKCEYTAANIILFLHVNRMNSQRGS